MASRSNEGEPFGINHSMNESSPLGRVESSANRDDRTGSAAEVLRIFTWLGLTCFGGPIAHLAYFRAEFVERRRWLSERAYADLVGLCQFLPGPASSKLGFSLGLMRAGYAGGLAAWVGFTAPSAILLVLFAYAAGTFSDTVVGQALFHSLKLVAVAIVAQAVWSMARALCPDRQRAAIAVGAAVLVLAVPRSISQIAAIAFGAMLGLRYCRQAGESVPEPLHFPVSRRAGAMSLAAFALLLALSFSHAGNALVALFNAFYRSGALVFGGGHVVLPLLSEAVVKPGWLSQESFLAGYGAAQAVPGPLFSVAAYMGAVVRPAGGIGGAAIALIAIFLPGILLQVAALPFWSQLRSATPVQAAMRGVNAAVVGILAAALYMPVWTSAVLSKLDFAVALTSFVLLVAWRASALIVVLFTVVAGTALTLAVGNGLTLFGP
jgi:chromate transporter